ncbi:hypothetical protein EHEL_050865 [Encephalitozoon hellem ATCC 50504]|uniref:Uncharacterized protein n=1 Tax=Encephalitozoon hellem TaxID=27973 RepID=A0A9Q9C828_ENCHE|nr:uncharacterized protein EHEL_050865 [Encephalitozoon hellem ATCC 50504]AHL28929.1 hypothetical protein EHEL_050865 [Encephalitozoon hellem ATCC 50504]UTX43175.1 hypothetical protein GPU96_05g09150 [Encephalitozoon hellem]WEL38632.1 hypothetical protein PFJ87_05g01010 [Encephalitozoon hellem]
MENIKRNRRFLGIALINFAISVFILFHAPMFIPVSYISPKVCLRFASLFIYTFVYIFVLLGANVGRIAPNKLARRVIAVEQ